MIGLNFKAQVLWRWSIAALMIASDAPFLQAEPVVVKFDMPKGVGHMIMQAKINGRGPYQLGVDTGSPYTFVGPQLARQLGLGAGGGRVELQFGGMKVSNASMVVMNHPNLGTAAQSQGGLEGIIGHSVLSRYRYTIDFPNREIIFHGPPSNAPLGGAAKVAPTRGVVLGVTLEDLGAGTREARVVNVVAGGAADEAGLKRGDRIISFNDRAASQPQDVFDAVARLAPGHVLRLKVERGGKQLELSLKPRAGL